MTAKKFDELWNDVILPVYNEMNTDNVLYLKRNSKKKIYREYQKKKSFIKENYMRYEDTHLDRHKIAACVVYAIVKVNPIQVKTGEILKKFRSKEKFAREYEILNEYISLYTAFSIIESFRQYEDFLEEEEYPTKGFQRSKITLPITSNGQDYLYNTCLDLYFSKQRKEINVLTLANVFFLLELLDNKN